MNTNKQHSKKRKKIIRTITTHLQWNEKDALFIRITEALEEMAENSRQTLQLLEQTLKRKK